MLTFDKGMYKAHMHTYVACARDMNTTCSMMQSAIIQREHDVDRLKILEQSRWNVPSGLDRYMTNVR